MIGQSALLISVWLLSALPCDAQQKVLNEAPTHQGPFTPKFSTFVHAVLAEWKVPGLSLAVIDGSETYSEGFGFATLPDTKATPDTLWLGASTTKAFAAAALAHLIQENGTSHQALVKGWSTPISSIIRDDFVLADEWATNHITLEDAVSHRTGLPRHDLSWQHTANGTVTPLRDVVRNLRNVPLAAPPRSVFQYCNLMYVVVSYVIEVVTGKELKTVLHDTIWAPLGMTSTYLDIQDAKGSSHHLATGYCWNESSQSYGIVLHDTLQASSGAAGIISNVLDYSKWVRCLLFREGPFSNATHDDIRKPRTIASTTPVGGMDVTLYGLGWERTLFHGEVLYKHNGQGLSFGATVFWLPERKYGVVSFGNTFLTSNYAQEVIIRRLVEDKMAIPDTDRYNVSTRFHERLAKDDDEFSRADDMLYPNLPDKRLPGIDVNKLPGTYHSDGYGTFNLQSRVSKEGKSYLIAQRQDMVYDYHIRLEHVSGEFWTAYFLSNSGSRLPRQFFKSRFILAETGNVSALEVTFWDETPNTEALPTLFSKH